MTDLQFRMLELVLEIDAICKKHHIVYYLTGGSILGAVRHGGFIPWDDDIDIMMTRGEFAKFQQACRTDMADDREIITMVNTPCHTKVTIKYMNKSTSQFFRSQVLDTTGCGISLDIMILDPLPKDEAAKEQHIAEYVVYNELLTPFFMVNPYFYKYVPLYKQLQQEARKVGKEQVMARLYRHLFADEPAESDQYLYRWGQQLLIYDRSLLGKPRYLEFEGHMLPVPEKTIDFLRATYGDGWIYLPPVHQRETHVSNMSPSIAYCNWLRDIAPFLDRPKVLRHFVDRKKYNVDKAVPAHDMDVYNYRQYAIMKQLEFELSPRFSAQALAAMEDRALLAHVADYLSHQLSGGFFKNNIYIQIPDDALAVILHAMVRVGDYPKADKILKLRQASQAPLTDALAQLRRLIDEVRRTVCYFEDRRLAPGEVAPLSEMAPHVLALLEAAPRQLNAHRCVLELMGLAEFTPQQRTDAIAKALALFPDDEEIAFWAGCLLEQMGCPEQAQPLYRRALQTANGIILLRLREKGFTQEGAKHD